LYLSQRPEVVSEPEVVVEVVEPTEDTNTPPQDTPTVNFVSKFLDVFLAYTDTDRNVAQLSDGATIDSNLTDGQKLTIYATSQAGAPNIGSVKIDVSGIGSRMENAEPFALFGDNAKGDFFGGKNFSEGTYQITLTAYEGKNGSGSVLETIDLDFSIDKTGAPSVIVEDPVVVDQPVVVEVPVVEPDPIVINQPVVEPEPEVVVEAPVVVVDPVPTPEPEMDLARDSSPMSSGSSLIDISLVDTKTDSTVISLQDGMKLSSSDINGQKLTISAEAIDANTADIGSMKLVMGGYSRIENVEPYALFGDNGKGNFFGGKELSEGTHTATLTAYSGKQGKGSILEEITIQFEVGDYDSVIIDGTSSVVSSYSKSQDTGTAKVANDNSSITLEASSWKSLTHFKEITEMTVMEIDYSSPVEGEIQGIGLSNGKGQLGSTFFQLGGTQELGIQDFNDYEAGSGTNTYVIPIGEFFTGEFDELVLINDDDAGLGSSSTFDNISFYEAVA